VEPKPPVGETWDEWRTRVLQEWTGARVPETVPLLLDIGVDLREIRRDLKAVLERFAITVSKAGADGRPSAQIEQIQNVGESMASIIDDTIIQLVQQVAETERTG
jgi:hypothetical protein